jgi:hypothetical protein
MDTAILPHPSMRDVARQHLRLLLQGQNGVNSRDRLNHCPSLK